MDKLTDFGTLAEAQAYYTTTTRLITADRLTATLVACKALSYFLDSLGEVERGVILAITAGAEFNFIRTHPIGEAQLGKLQELIDSNDDEDIKRSLIHVRDAVEAYCNTKNYPYKNITQLQFDLAKIAKSYEGITTASVSYLGDGVFHNKIPNESIILVARVDTALPVDTKITTRIKIRDTISQEFSEISNWQVSWVLPADKHTMAFEITNTARLTKHTQFLVTSDKDNPFTIEVAGA